MSLQLDGDRSKPARRETWKRVVKDPCAASPTGYQDYSLIISGARFDDTHAQSGAELDESCGDARKSLRVPASLRDPGRERLLEKSNDLDLSSEKLSDESDSERDVRPCRAGCLRSPGS